MFGNIMLIVLWFLVVPILVGRLCMAKGIGNSLKIFSAMPAGYMVLFALFEVITLPMLYMKKELHLLTLIWSAVCILLSVASLVFRPFPVKFMVHNVKIHLKEKPWILMLLAGVFIFSQMVLLSYFQHIDEDDAFYVGSAVAAYDTDTIFEYDAYTGEAYKKLPARYVLSPFPVYLAVVSKLTLLRPAETAHTVMPIIFILLAYIVDFNIAGVLFPGEQKSKYLFLILISVLNIYGNFSVYTTSSFLLFRIWQGKAVLANIVLPFAFYQMAQILKNGKSNRRWCVMFAAMTAACMVSSMGVFLAPMMLGAMALVCAASRKKFMFLGKATICVLPCMLLGIAYLAMR
ncbi:DUF6077 domain-containing protein [Lachnospiraceae bacterium ZAX-1]